MPLTTPSTLGDNTANYVGKFLGEVKILEASASKYVTPQGRGIINFMLENGTNRHVPIAMAEQVVTAEPLDATAFRDRRVEIMCKAILELLAEMDAKYNELDSINFTIKQSTLNSFAVAEEKMWGTDEKTMLDVQRVLETGATLKDVGAA